MHIYIYIYTKQLIKMNKIIAFTSILSFLIQQIIMQHVIQMLLIILPTVFCERINNLFRVNHVQRLYFFVFNLQLYNYHQNQYDGIIREVLDFANFVQEQFWNFLSIEKVLDWVNEPFPLASFNPYTNKKFMEIERRDSQYFQNTKSYFIIYLPFSVLTFFIMNRLFYLLFEFKISLFMRLYSMWMYLLYIAANENIDIMIFLAVRHFQNLFRFDFSNLLSQAFSIAFIGLFFISCLAFFPITLYFYGRLSKYFLSNMFRIEGAFLLMALRYSIKPLVESTIHALLFDRPGLQLALLSASCFVTFVSIIVIEFKNSIFIIKTVFVCDCLMEANFICLNILMYLKYYCGYDQPMLDLMQECIRAVMHFFLAISLVYFLNSLMLFKQLKKQKIINELDRKLKNHERAKINQNSPLFDKSEKRVTSKKAKSNIHNILKLKQSHKLKKHLKVNSDGTSDLKQSSIVNVNVNVNSSQYKQKKQNKIKLTLKVNNTYFRRNL